jgi:hypothetical protein
MSIFDRFKRGPADSAEVPQAEPVAPEVETSVAGAEGAAPEVGPASAEVEPAAEPSQAVVPAVDAGATMPLPLAELEAAIASADAAASDAAAAVASEVPPVAPPVVPTGPLAPERLVDPDDLPFLARRAQVIPDRHGDPMESMGNIFDVAILLAVGFLVVSLSSFGLSDLLGRGDVTIVKNPGTNGMELVTKKNGVISRMRTTTRQAEGVGAAIGTVYKLENGEIVWVPGLPGAGAAAGTSPTTPSTPTSGTYAPPVGTPPGGQIGADGPTVAPTP